MPRPTAAKLSAQPRARRPGTARRTRPSCSRPGGRGPWWRGEGMTLNLVASGDDRALAIRDRLLPLVRARGALEVQRGPVRLVVLRAEPWSIGHWTPFGDLSPGEASSPGYRHALG